MASKPLHRTAPPTKRLFSETDAAEYLAISQSALRQENIPRKCLGRRRVYERADLDAFADGLPFENEGEQKWAKADAVFDCAG